MGGSRVKESIRYQAVVFRIVSFPVYIQVEGVSRTEKGAGPDTTTNLLVSSLGGFLDLCFLGNSSVQIT